MLTYELLFARLAVVYTQLADLDTTIAAVAAVELHALTAEALGTAAISLQHFLDRLTLVHARVVVEADRAGVWAGSGYRNVADWLAGHTKTSHSDAMDRVKLGDAADLSPELNTAVATGEMSAKSAVSLHSAIKSAPSGSDVAGLVAATKGASPREAHAAGEKFREMNRPRPETPEEAEERRYQRRSVRAGHADDGLVTTTVILPVLQHRQFWNTISHIAGDPYDGDARTTEQRLADGLTLLCDAWAKGTVSGGRERPTLLLVMDAESYTGANDEPATTGQRDHIPAHIARRLAENANLQRVIRAGTHILDLGRSARYATEQQYRALLVRDGGCRWPGCHIPAAWCELDHITPWEAGGTTDLSNLVMWCSHHHHEKHRPGVTVSGDAHDLWLTLANGSSVHCPAPPRTTSAAA